MSDPGISPVDDFDAQERRTDDLDRDMAALLRAMTRTDPAQRPSTAAVAAELRGVRRLREHAVRAS